MRLASLVRNRFTSVLTTSALIAAGLAVSALTAPVAAAELSPVASPAPTNVTADALPTVQVDGVVWDQAVVGNTVWVGGQFANARPAGAAANTQLTSRNNLLAYDVSTGALITSIAPSMNAQVKVIAASPDGTRIYAGGTFTTTNGVTRYRIAAFNAQTGALITTFAPSINSGVTAIAATNTTVYVAGTFSSAGGQARTRLAAFNAADGKVTSWAPTADAGVNAMVLSPDGKIIIGGSFQNVNMAPAYGLAALDSTGTMQPWAASNTIRNAGTQAAILSLMTDGTNIIGTGYVFGPGGNLEGTFSANPVTGNVNWVEDCHGDTYDAYSDGSEVYTVSHAHYCGNIGGFPQSNPWAINQRHALAFTSGATGTIGNDPLGYFNWAGTPSPSLVNWFPDLAIGSITGKNQAAWSVTGNGQYVVMGGEFPSVNGVAQQGLVRFAVPSKAPNKVGPNDKGAAFNPSIIGLPSGAARIAWKSNWDMDDHTLTYRLTRNGVQIYQVIGDSTFWSKSTLGYIDPAAGLVPGTVYKYRLSATDAAGNISQSETVNFTATAAGTSSAYANRVIADGASPYWPMNEAAGTVLFDNSTAFNDADTSAGVTRGVSGAIAGDSATTFDGATSSATRTAITGPNTFTTQAWIKTSTTSGGKIIGFGAGQTGLSGSYDRMVYMDNAGHLFFGVYPNFVATVNSSASYNDGQWHQITATLGADGMKLYVDSKLVGQRSDVTSGQAYAGYWRVGGDNLGGWPNQPSSSYFAGSIDEVAIYPTVLTRQTINAQWVASGRTSTIPAAPVDPYGAAVYNDNPLLFWRLGESGGTTAADSGQNGDQTGIYENGVTQGVAGGIKGTTNTAAAFDGSDDVVASTNAFNNPTNYSEEVWFKTTTTNGGKLIGFGSAQNGTSGNYDRHVYMNNDGKVTFGVWTGQTNTITTSGALNDGRWHHLVATQSTTDGMKLYVDGALSGVNGQTDSQSYSGYWRVGGDNHWGCCSPFIQATIDDAAVYNTVLTPAQVSNHFNLGNTIVAANPAPTASFTSSAVNLTVGSDATASADTNGTITGYAWDFGDNTNGTGVTPSHVYTAAGTYTVTLTVTDNGGETAVTTRSVITTAVPNSPPTATFASGSTLLNASYDASGSADTDGTITGYAWDFGDTINGTGVTTTHAYAAAGSYTVVLVVTDDKGGTGTTTQTVVITAPVNQAPVANFSVIPVQLTANVDATGSADPDGTIASYAWDFGDGGKATGATASHTYGVAGPYTITLTVTDNKGASSTAIKSVEVSAPPANQPPSPGFHFTADGLTANVESTSTDIDGTVVAWAWDFSDGGTATTKAAMHTFAASGTYPITLVVTDNSGATATQTQSVVVTAPPAANVAPTAAFTFTTSGLQASLNGGGSTDGDGTIAAYSWNFGDNSTDLVTGPSANHPFAAAGAYQVTLTVTDNLGAVGTITKTVTVSTPVAAPIFNDTFGRTSVNGWGAADLGGAWTTTGTAANYSVNTGTGKIKMAAAGSSPAVTSAAALTSANNDITFNVSLDKAATGGGVYLSVATRKIGTSEYRATTKFLSGGVVQVQLLKIVNGVSTSIRAVTVTGLTYNAGDVVTIRFQVSGTASVALNAKVWKVGTTEPTAWQASATDASATLAAAGSVALYPYLSGSATNAPIVATIDNLTVFATTP